MSIYIRCNNSLGEQIKHWVKIGKALEDNPELSFIFAQEIITAQEEISLGKVIPYLFDDFSC